MNKRMPLFVAVIAASFTCAAQNNPIFAGGPGDGWARSNYLQAPDNNIFTGGAGDGWASNNFQQPENNIYAGGAGDGWTSELSNMVQIDFGTMVGDAELRSSMHAYPNPTSGLLNVDLTGNWGPVTIEIHSASGQLVRSERYTNTSTMVIDIPGASGPYHVRVSTGANEHTTFRIFKQ